MQRICTTLAENGYAITLVGRKLNSSILLTEKKYRQKRIRCWFKKGKLFYFEYNLRLTIYLLFQKMDAVCAIDLDTIIPCHTISRWKRIQRVYDAHELFTEMKEVITRPRIRKIWTKVERRLVPKFNLGYTVSESIADEFQKRYGVKYQTIRNLPVWKPLHEIQPHEIFILYQGAVNEARGFEFLIPAMQEVNCKLVVCGDGNFMSKLKSLIAEYKLENKIELKGLMSPDEIRKISQQATIGMALAEKEGLNQYLALPNKFFDYVHAGLPQITMNYPEYIKINNQFEVAILLEDLDPKKIAAAINNLLSDEIQLRKLKNNCIKARDELNWQIEEKKLIAFYHSVFAN
jgi:glycosyltransferase involved in cell wall biosynthesis